MGQRDVSIYHIVLRLDIVLTSTFLDDADLLQQATNDLAEYQKSTIRHL